MICLSQIQHVLSKPKGWHLYDPDLTQGEGGLNGGHVGGGMGGGGGRGGKTKTDNTPRNYYTAYELELQNINEKAACVELRVSFIMGSGCSHYTKREAQMEYGVRYSRENGRIAIRARLIGQYLLAFAPALMMRAMGKTLAELVNGIGLAVKRSIIHRS